MAAELGQQTVDFSALVQRAAEDSYLALKELVESSKASGELRSDAEKKIDLLKFVAKTRQRMLRLHILAKWCQQVPLIHYCRQLASTLSSHDSCFTQTADSLFFMHEVLQQARAPLFDVPSAIEVLLTGGYQRLPKCIEDLSIQSSLPKDEQKLALTKLDTLVRSKLLEVSLPKEISDITISDGTAVLSVNGEFKVFLTLGYHGHLSLWRILHLELLVGEKNGPIKLEESRRFALGDDLERRMAAAQNPFFILYTILHELCIALVMDTVLRQVQVLRQGRWKDAIRFELISDGTAGLGGSSSALQLSQDVENDSSGLKTPGLKIIYWLDLEKNSGASDFTSCPYIKVDPGHDTQIKCSHNSFVLDPFTDKEASFSLNLSCIDVEKLLLRVIACNRHTRLLEIQRELTKNVQICQGSDDVILCHEKGKGADLQKKDDKLDTANYFGDEVLHVRAFGASYITLGMNIRNGKFLLQSSKNILATSTLSDCEEALNVGNLSATDVFANLRSKSILNGFASMGRFLGLQVHDNLSNLKIPETISHGSDRLLMGFPQCVNTYYLLLNVDKDFKPVFNLLESQLNPDGKSHSLSDVNQFLRFNKIDIGQMQMIDNELNMSLFGWESVHTLSNTETFNQLAEHGLSPDFGQEACLQLPSYSQSSFSSVVDEVFGFEKGASSSFITGSQQTSTYKMTMSSHLSSLHTSQPGGKSGISSPKWEGRLQQSLSNNAVEISSGLMGSTNAVHLLNSMKGYAQNVAASSLSSSPLSSSNKLSSSRSDQNLSNHKSPYSAKFGQFPTMNDDRLRFTNEPSKELRKVDRGQPSSLQSNPNKFKSSSTGNLNGLIKGQTPDCRVLFNPIYDHRSKHEKNSRKRSLLDILMALPSFQMSKGVSRQPKRRKLLKSPVSFSAGLVLPSSTSSCKTGRYTFDHLLSESNHAITPLNVFASVLLHVVRHCLLCIKHAQLTSQMDALDIPYVEEVGLRTPSSNLWLKLPFATSNMWHRICLGLGKPGTMCWDVKIDDLHFRELWELHTGSTRTTWGSGLRFANTSEVDSHIHCDSEGVILCYKTVESDSIQKLVSDLRRLYNARLFVCGMRKLVGLRADNKIDENNTVSDSKIPSSGKVSNEAGDKLSEQMRRTFKIEAVGLMTLWFSYGSMPVVHFVVEWEVGQDGCTIHVSPDQLWPHTKFLEDFINGGEVASFLDCIRLTAGPLLALCGAIRPARIPAVSSGYSSIPKQNAFVQSQGNLANASLNMLHPSPNVSATAAVIAQLSSQSLHAATVLSAAGRSVPGLVPSSLLPFDVSVVLRGPYWIRIIYRKKFAVDMRCFAGDQVWLQPATPPKGGPAVGGSLPCPQFRPFIMEHVAQGLNTLEPSFTGASHAGLQLGSSNTNSSLGTQPVPPSANCLNVASVGAIPKPNTGVGTQIGSGINRVGSAMLASSSLNQGISGVPLRISPVIGFPLQVKGELNTAFIGLGDDGGYGGGWVPLAALKKVLRGILKYLGVLWLFAQLPDLLKEILGSILKENEGTLLNLDQEQPALRFFVGGYVFAVSVHRVQLLLQVLSVKRFHHQQQQQNQANNQEELTSAEINEICDYFSRRVASEPYDASRVASFITLLTLPVSVLREFLKLISWKKGLSHSHGGDIATPQRPRIELCLENHLGSISDESSGTTSSSKSNIHHDRDHSSIDFALTFVLDLAHIPHLNAVGGAAWLPYCVSVRLKYFFGENTRVTFLAMEGSHGGRACWSHPEDWERCKQRMAKTSEISNGSSVDISQGRLKLIAEALQRTLQVSLQQLRDGGSSSFTSGI